MTSLPASRFAAIDLGIKNCQSLPDRKRCIDADSLCQRQGAGKGLPNGVARYFGERFTPEAGALRRRLEAGAESMMALPEEAFARG